MSSSRPRSTFVPVSTSSIVRLLSEGHTATLLLASGAVARREAELEAHHSSPSAPSSPDCAAENPIRMGEPIRCRECGHRVMYKPRTKRSESLEEVCELVREGREKLTDQPVVVSCLLLGPQWSVCSLDCLKSQWESIR